MYKAHLHGCSEVAVKVLEVWPGADMARAVAEARLLAQCKHSNVLQLYGVCQGR